MPEIQCLFGWDFVLPCSVSITGKTLFGVLSIPDLASLNSCTTASLLRRMWKQSINYACHANFIGRGFFSLTWLQIVLHWCLMLHVPLIRPCWFVKYNKIKGIILWLMRWVLQLPTWLFFSILFTIMWLFLFWFFLKKYIDFFLDSNHMFLFLFFRENGFCCYLFLLLWIWCTERIFKLFQTMEPVGKLNDFFPP